MAKQTARLRTGFTFYRSFRDAVAMLSPRDQLTLYRAIADYALDQRQPDLDAMSRTARICWVTILPNLTSGVEGFRNGCKGGAPKGNSNARKTDRKQPRNNTPSNAPTSNGDGYDDENGDERTERDGCAHNLCSEPVQFTPPTLEEVSDYIALKGLDTDAGHFVDYYTANGWRVGRAHMRDWRAALRNWARREDSAAFSLSLKIADNELPRPLYQAL